jgi:hypothetical protein
MYFQGAGFEIRRATPAVMTGIFRGFSFVL